MSSVLLIGKETDPVRSIAQALAAVDCHCERARGSAGAIRCLRQQSFDVVITDPDTTIDEGLALIEEMRDIRPGMKAILLAPSSTPEEIIAALRARVFVCFSAPFDVHEIASFACRATTEFSAGRFENHLVGGAARFWRRGGLPPTPAFPRGETGKGRNSSARFLPGGGRSTKSGTPLSSLASERIRGP